MPKAAEIALAAAQPRLSDNAYALRIVVDVLIRETGCRDQETGAGLLFTPGAEDEYNNDRPSVVIDLTKNKVEVRRKAQPVSG